MLEEFFREVDFEPVPENTMSVLDSYSNVAEQKT